MVFLLGWVQDCLGCDCLGVCDGCVFGMFDCVGGLIVWLVILVGILQTFPSS